MSVTDDIVAIQQLVARANRAVDAGDGDAFAATFVTDGVTVSPGRETQGYDALADLGRTLAGTVPNLRHWVNNHVIDVDGDEARATLYLVALGGDDGRTILATGHYRDHLRRTPDGWRFVRREFSTNTTEPTDGS